MMNRYTLLFSLLFAALIGLHANAKAQATNLDDSLALVDLYKSTDGAGWIHSNNWLTAPVNSWYGITVTDHRVTRLSLAFNNLSGPIPASIGRLEMLQYADVQFNNLTGSIPDDIAQLTHLTELYLSSNYLTGTIPAAITGMVNMEKLYLDFNELSGGIPANIGKLTHLIQLQLEYNQVNGTIPASVSKLSNLLGLYLSHNQLSGTIPDFDGATALLDLYLDHNQLTGSIPASFRNLKRLVIANLSYNQLSQTGNINFPIADPRPGGFGNISYNNFTFDGLEFIANKLPQIVYAPQARITLHQNGNSLSVNAGGTLSNNTYNWFQVGNKVSTTVKGDSVFTPLASGKYFVKVTNAIAKKLTLASDTIDFVAGGLIAGKIISAGTNSRAVNSGLQVFPNPASSVVHLKTTCEAAIIMTNESGVVMLTQTITNNASINVSALANGIYYFQNKTTGEVKKIIVQH